ncbi:hypothetical protein PF005_g29689 [Phytophthora fragariae]|nr:hypothetical protein PF003_g18549 [Phytophthora fragariae]KAE8919648.1 hypothetical protein PF009_g30049 [Phytophthora fragariae]KAE8981635.1 hypothetical protein PF011_g21943 [Phytophthora fragariae]KAE9062612.1 hypothetical protein PF010_g29331 [Phytophthora fragariae]KAE9073200.1 hypothetical protein PF006_g28790 [Phytophthora fragariae]
MVGGGTASTARSSTPLIRHHAVLEPHFNGEVVTERVQAAMKRRRLSLDTLHVARLSLAMLVEPAVRPRPKGDFVDANVSGGKLLTYEEMEATVKSKAAAAEAKQLAKKEAAAARALRKAETVSRKEARQQTNVARREAAQRKKAAIAGPSRMPCATLPLNRDPVVEAVVAFADV